MDKCATDPHSVHRNRDLRSSIRYAYMHLAQSAGRLLHERGVVRQTEITDGLRDGCEEWIGRIHTLRFRHG
jgi:hypothetical protein